MISLRLTKAAVVDVPLKRHVSVCQNIILLVRHELGQAQIILTIILIVGYIFFY